MLLTIKLGREPTMNCEQMKSTSIISHIDFLLRFFENISEICYIKLPPVPCTKVLYY